MYSRSLITNTTDGKSPLESFNENLREQYNRKRSFKPHEITSVKESEPVHNSLTPIIESTKESLERIMTISDIDDIVIIALIVFLLSDGANNDLILIGILISLLL